MPIVLRHNPEHEISHVEYYGVIASADLAAHAKFNADNPVWLGFDCLSVAAANVDPSELSLADLNLVFNDNQTLFRPLDFLIMRRSAWLCDSTAARPLLLHWLGLRSATEYAWSDIRLFDAFDDAAEWLLANPLAREALRTRSGFTEIARFETVRAPRAAAR